MRRRREACRPAQAMQATRIGCSCGYLTTTALLTQACQHPGLAAVFQHMFCSHSPMQAAEPAHLSRAHAALCFLLHGPDVLGFSVRDTSAEMCRNFTRLRHCKHAEWRHARHKGQGAPQVPKPEGMHASRDRSLNAARMLTLSFSCTPERCLHTHDRWCGGGEAIPIHSVTAQAACLHAPTHAREMDGQ